MPTKVNSVVQKHSVLRVAVKVRLSHKTLKGNAEEQKQSGQSFTALRVQLQLCFKYCWLNWKKAVCGMWHECADATQMGVHGCSGCWCSFVWNTTFFKKEISFLATAVAKLVWIWFQQSYKNFSWLGDTPNVAQLCSVWWLHRLIFQRTWNKF